MEGEVNAKKAASAGGKVLHTVNKPSDGDSSSSCNNTICTLQFRKAHIITRIDWWYLEFELYY